MNPGGGACSEQRSRHCTPAWATEQNSVSKKKKMPGIVHRAAKSVHFIMYLFFVLSQIGWVPFPEDRYLCKQEENSMEVLTDHLRERPLGEQAGPT